MRVLFGLAIAAALSSPAHAEAHGPDAGTVVATVNGVDITVGHMILTANRLPPQYQQLDDQVLFDGILDQLIEQQLFADTFESDPERVTMALENDRRGLLAGEALNDLLGEAITDAAVEARYDALFADFDPQTEWSASHILVETEREAISAKERIELGGVFADVARELSLDPGSGANGGSLGWFGPGRMVQPFEEAVANLEIGEMSDPFETQFGWHIVLLDDIREQAQPPLPVVAEEIRDNLRQEALTERVEELRQDAEITVVEEGALDPSLVRSVDLLRR